MKRRISLTCVAVLALVAGQAQAASYSTIGTPYPNVGSDVNHLPGVIFTINPDLSVSTNITGEPAYDSILFPPGEDTYVAVVNNSGIGVLSLALSGANIFGFDGDGFQTFGIVGPPGNGYEGPGTHFTVANASNGVVEFTDAGGLPSGQYAIFSLEESPRANGITIGPVTPATPEPSTLVVWSALAVLGLVGNAWRKRRSA